MFDTFEMPVRSSAPPPFAQPAAVSGLAVFVGQAGGDGRLERLAAAAGLQVVHLETSVDVRDTARTSRIELIVLGALAGGQIDYSACHELSRLGIAPLMVMAERDDATNRILALELGADEWVTAECCDRELAARLKAMTRRRVPEPFSDTGASYVRFAGRRLNSLTGEVVLADGAIVHLSRAELLMLRLFLNNTGRVVTRAELLAAQGSTTTQDRNVVVAVFRLRKKLGAQGEELIRTVRSLGYVMDGPVAGRP